MYDLDLQKQAYDILNAYLHDLGTKKLYNDFINGNVLVKTLTKGSAKINHTNIVLNKELDKPVVRWTNKNSRQNTDYENKVLEIIDGCLPPEISLIKDRNSPAIDIEDTVFYDSYGSEGSIVDIENSVKYSSDTNGELVVALNQVCMNYTGYNLVEYKLPQERVATDLSLEGNNSGYKNPGEPNEHSASSITGSYIENCTNSYPTIPNFEYSVPSNISYSGYWYKDEDVNNLLNSELRDEAIIMAAPKFENKEELEDRLTNGIKDWVYNPFQPIVIPINLHDNHWVSLIIKKQEDNNFQVIYNDSKGRSVQNEENSEYLVQIITELLGENTNIIDLQVAQQPSDNDDDCGVFTVDNLIRLVRTNTNGLSVEEIRAHLPIPETGNANHIRMEHARLLLEQEREDFVQNKSGTDEISDLGSDIQQTNDQVDVAGAGNDFVADHLEG